jgi:predicted amidophosphoribosyltransferase
MATRIHRDNLIFRWITKNHEIVVGFKSVKYGRCSLCGKKTSLDSNICDECFDKGKDISKK